MTNSESGQNIAVIGGGVAGIVSAYLLQQKHRVTIFEQNDYLGGHTHTIEIADGPDAGVGVDTGFIVLNDATYPLFKRFLARLGVATRLSEMSFGFCCQQTGLVYAGTDFSGLFAQRRNLLRTQFYRFLFEIIRFNRKAQRDMLQKTVPTGTLGDYLQAGRFSPYMIDNYLLPMAAAIWSTPTRQVKEFPAEPFLRFFHNHGLLSIRNRPQWRTVVGGSHAYVKAFLRDFQGKVHLKTPIRSLSRDADGVSLTLGDGTGQRFDQVVVATHADQALRLLADPSPDEQRLLSPWYYQDNRTVLHTDVSLLPKQRHAWAAWNFKREADSSGDRPVFVSYYMNRLQGLTTNSDYCVTLNRQTEFSKAAVIADLNYQHPLYSFASLQSQSALPQLNGRARSYFCGSYFGYGFHEDAVKAGVAVANAFGVEL
jgi:predicted NAD/FAD-binding protein